MSVYLDHAATTPLRAEARQAFVGALDILGNPSSIHSHGQNARRLLEESRELIATELDCEPIEVVFTSGGTESINFAIVGAFRAAKEKGKTRILVPQGEHHATIDTVEWLVKNEGAIAQWLPVDEYGRLASETLESVLGEHQDCALLSLIWANNEVGTIQPVPELAAIAADYSLPVHVDAVGAFKHVEITFRDTAISALSISSHKIGGPHGIGAVAIKRNAAIKPLLHGGGQERGLRPGTQNVAAVVGFAAAARLPKSNMQVLRDELISGIQRVIPQARLMGDPINRLDSNAHFIFPGAQGDSLLFLLDAEGISVSTGSACQAGVPEVSHVLLGMGLDPSEAIGALRFSLGVDSTREDISQLLRAIPSVYAKALKAGLSDRNVKSNT
ncbi:MAG: cysteine desulfurase [Microbacteriaceae bacterium]|nr:cysteine desulfurase [Cryobacterium sp.]MCC6375774.1 cysteine desulfurase [Microbacteriaceae bacterium]